jgi:hypothetical protein
VPASAKNFREIREAFVDIMAGVVDRPTEETAQMFSRLEARAINLGVPFDLDIAKATVLKAVDEDDEGPIHDEW